MHQSTGHFLFYFRPSSVPYLHTNCTAIIFPNVICVAILRYYPGLNINASLTPVTKNNQSSNQKLLCNHQNASIILILLHLSQWGIVDIANACTV